MKIKILLFFVFLCTLSSALNAKNTYVDYTCKAEQSKFDPRGKFDPEQFRRDLIAYITKEVGLTDEEARAFFPVFFEMREKMRNIEHQKGRVVHKGTEKPLAERDCQRILDEMTALDKKSISIEIQYLTRLRKKIGAAKLLRAINADREFGRRTFRKMTR